MFRRIMVPVDGSTFAEHALPYAAHVARLFAAKLELSLVHVNYEPATADLSLRQAIHEWERDHRHREAEYLRRVATRLSGEIGRDVEPVMLSGDVVPALEQEIGRRGVDLVVMTTHGRAGFERAWLGSVADSLVRHIDVPVLLIRAADENAPVGPDEGTSPFRSVVVALDGSERAERAIQPALSLVRADEGRMTLVRIIAPRVAATSPFIPHAVQLTRIEIAERTREAQAYIDAKVEELRLRGVDARGAVIVDYHPAHALLRYAEQCAADLIALGTHGRGPVARLVLGSVSDKVVRAAEVPVLVC
jgi:nucleotide-binding universal stress UspA family protein